MRIRTVKPEFWTHPVMGRLDGASQALAIGLLNLADDAGYFPADPAVVRSALRPFDDDSTIVRRSLGECLRAGWIEVRTHPAYGPVGWVVNFTKHQRIDRPRQSNLAKYWNDFVFDDDSTIDRRMLDEGSLLEGKGREGKGNGKELLLVDQSPTTINSTCEEQPQLSLIAPPNKTNPPPKSLEDHLQAEADKYTADEFTVLDHWRKVMTSPTSRATPERRKLIAKALKWFTLEQVLDAIDGCAASKWHMGENDRHTKYNSLEFILNPRKTDRTEEFISRGKGTTSATNARR